MNIKQGTMAAAVISVMGLGITGNAQAAAYGYSFNELRGVTTTFTCATSGVGCANPDNFNFTSYQSSSQSDANLDANNSTGVSASQVRSGIVTAGNITGFLPNNSHPDAPLSFEQIGGVANPGNNSWTAIGKTPASGTDYARGDAQIVTEEASFLFTGNTNTRAINVAEGLIKTVDSATSNGSNTSTSGFIIGFNVLENWSVSINFEALPFMEAFISQGGVSTTDLDVSVTIRDVGTNAVVFNWAPNGLVDLAGTGVVAEGADDASMNLEISDDTNNGLSEFYNPLITDADCAGGKCDYNVTSASFAPGSYSMILTFHEGVVLSQVPEPASLALLGLGLMGLGISRRGSRKAQE